MFRGKLRIQMYDSNNYAVYEYTKNGIEVCYIGTYSECRTYIANVNKSPIGFIFDSLAISKG